MKSNSQKWHKSVLKIFMQPLDTDLLDTKHCRRQKRYNGSINYFGGLAFGLSPIFFGGTERHYETRSKDWIEKKEVRFGPLGIITGFRMSLSNSNAGYSKSGTSCVLQPE